MSESRYNIIHKVRENSRYILYKANRISDTKLVTIQTFRSDYPTFRDLNQLKQESALLSKLSHPNIIQSIGLERMGNLPVLVKEEILGETLSEYLTKGNLGLIDFLKISIGITKAVLYLHSKQVIHKSISSSNIVIETATREIKVWGFDFAIEKGRDSNYSNVSEAIEVGLQYISPEQTGRMNRPIDHRTDLYSMGAVFYELLTGFTPFRIEDPIELIHAHLAVVPDPPRKYRMDLPPMIEQIVLKLLQKNTEDRYQSCAGLLYDLEQCLDRLLDTNEIIEFTLGTQDHSDQFHISSKLYGREEELAILNEAFQRTKVGKVELALVSGYSGVGKSSFVREFQKYVDLQGGFFISGKFEQYKKNPPLSSVLSALNDLIDQILIRGEEQREYWRNITLQAVGNSGQIIIDMIPELEILIGPQPAVPELPMTESSNRFDQVFNSFIRAFARKDHPLCIFLDDLQWLDSTTRRWMETTLDDPGLKYLFVISAYRENEVSPSHPLKLMLERLSTNKLTISEIAIKPLEESSVEELISDSLAISREKTRGLSEIVYRKTLGNPFFIRQCLLTLYESGAIYLSTNTREWTYSSEKAYRVKISDNVIDLMTELFFRLPSEVQTNLKYASCIGNTFSLSTLSELVNVGEEELDLQLKLAEKLCILENFKAKEKTDEGDYGFQHDKIQQAALAMLPDSEKKRVRFNIAKSILKNSGNVEHSDLVYAVADHLNFAKTLIKDENLLNQLVSLNLAASMRAKYANAYDSSLNYVKTAIDLVNQHKLSISKEMLRDIHLERAESEHLNGNNDQVDAYFELALQNVENLLDKGRVTIRKIQFYNHIRRFQDAYTACREVTAELGVSIPANFSPPGLIIEYLKYKILNRSRKIEELINLPEMKNEKLKIAIKLMAAAGQSAFQIQPELCVALCASMVNISLKHGNSEGASIGYLGFGPVFHSGILKQWKTGLNIGQLTLALIDKYQSYSSKPEVYFVTGYFAVPWQKPAVEMEKYWQVAYETGLEVGDQFHASCACCGLMQSYFMRGVRFDQILETGDAYLDFLHRIRNEEAVLTIAAVSQSIKNLKSQTLETGSYSDADFDENRYVEKLSTFRSRHFAHFYYINKMQSLYLWEKYGDAYKISEISDTYLKDSPGMLHTAEHYFYKGLILAALIPAAASIQGLKWKRILAGIVRKFKKYSANSPSNFEHKYQILAAEQARIRGEIDEALKHYYLALEQAETHGYLQIQALANRRLFDLNLTMGMRKLAAIHLSDAEYLYYLLGATGIEDLLAKKRISTNFSEREFRVGNRIGERQKSKEGISDQDLDLKSVMKSSVAISKEIRLKDLLTTLMKIIIENAGAQRIVFLLKNENQWMVQSESFTGKEEPNFFLKLSLNEFDSIAKEVVKNAIKTNDSVLLDDASHDKKYARDSYIQRTNPKSILCVPLIKQNVCTGVIYLENNLVQGAFTKERIELINILSSQMAISLENALLYENMEDKIQLRTKQLNQEKEKSDELLLNILPPEIAAELKSHGVSRAQKFENVTVMFTDIVNFSSLCEILPAEDLVAELNDFYSEFDRIVEKYGIEKIKTIGDSYMCAGGLNKTKAFDPCNMVLAAFEIREFIQRHQEFSKNEGRIPIDMRIGMHTGTVIAGIVGLRKFAYDIWGDAVNIASRMETAGEPGKINVSERTKVLIEEKFRCIPRGKLEVKNKGLIEMFFVEEEK